MIRGSGHDYRVTLMRAVLYSPARETMIVYPCSDNQCLYIHTHCVLVHHNTYRFAFCLGSYVGAMCRMSAISMHSLLPQKNLQVILQLSRTAYIESNEGTHFGIYTLK